MDTTNSPGSPAPNSGPGNYAAYPPPYSGPGSYTPPAGYPSYAPPYSGPSRYSTAGRWRAYPLVGHPNVAALVEIGSSLFGLLGIGHLAAGRIRSGGLLLLASLAYMALGWVLFLPLIVTTCGLAFCFGPLLWLVPVFSGLWLRHTLLKRQAWGP